MSWGMYSQWLALDALVARVVAVGDVASGVALAAAGVLAIPVAFAVDRVYQSI